jgi:hypothetical protein
MQSLFITASRKRTWLSVSLQTVLPWLMALKSRAARWQKMAEDARHLADRMNDPIAKRMMLEIAASYDQLAAWAAKTNAADADRLD